MYYQEHGTYPPKRRLERKVERQGHTKASQQGLYECGARGVHSYI